MEEKDILREYKFLWTSFSAGAQRFIKYQIATKLLFSLLILPIFWGATQMLIHSKGMGAISNSQMMRFIFSPQGIIFLLAGIFVFICGILIEMCGFITISAQLLNGRPESSYKELLKSNFQQLPRMLEFGSLILLLYVIILIPLTGAGATLSFLKGVRIPNFISSVIEGNVLYSSLYGLLILFMVIFSIRWIFTFQFMVIGQSSPSVAMKKSAKMIRRNWKDFLKHFILIALINGVVLVGILLLWMMLIALMLGSMNLEGVTGRIIVITFIFLQNIVLALAALLFIPFELHHLTMIFYRFTGKTTEFSDLEQRYPQLPQKTKPSIIDKLLKRKKTAGALLLAAIILASIPIGIFFDEIFRRNADILVVGHRGGGGIGIPENSISSIRKSIENKADYVEIDVQRTKDGAYIINHDANFSRMAGDNRTAQEMTLKEIKKLDIGANFPGYQGEKVLTLEELLDFCKGKVGVFIELKGISADEKMADEVIQMVRDRAMKDEILIMSLDYDLIRYVRNNYEDMDTGFVYFIALGDAGTFDSNFIILEEDAATDKTLSNIHSAGKYAVVWTVNKQESMDLFAKKEVDAIITDDVKQMKDTLEAHGKKTTADIMLDLLFDE